MTITNFFEEYTKSTNLNIDDAIDNVQKAYEYTVNKLRLNVFMLPCLLNGTADSTTAAIYQDGELLSNINIKEIATIYRAEVQYNTQISTPDTDIIVCQQPSEITSSLYNKVIYRSHNSLWTEEESGFIMLAHVKPYFIVGVNPFVNTMSYGIDYQLSLYPTAHVANILLYPVTAKALAIYHYDEGDLSGGSYGDTLFTQYLNIYNKNLDSVVNANFTDAGFIWKINELIKNET